MTGRTRFGPNVIDTEQLYDASVTIPKLGADVVSAMTAITTAITTATKEVVKYVSIDMTVTGTVVTPICTIPSMSVVTDIYTVCEVARTGNGTMTIGDANDPDGYLTDANITKTLNAVSGVDPATRGALLWTPGAQDGTTPFAVQTYGHAIQTFYLAPVVANVTNAKGSNTTGQMGVYLVYHKVTPS